MFYVGFSPNSVIFERKKRQVGKYFRVYTIIHRMPFSGRKIKYEWKMRLVPDGPLRYILVLIRSKAEFQPVSIYVGYGQMAHGKWFPYLIYV